MRTFATLNPEAVVRSVQPHLSENSRAWCELCEEAAYWLNAASALSTPPTPEAEPVQQDTRYWTQPAESLMGIALRQLKDESRWTEIRDLNAASFPDMGPHDYYPVGTALKMPAEKQAAPSGEDNHG